MRRFFIGISALSLALATAAPAIAQRAKAHRAVQIISMGGPAAINPEAPRNEAFAGNIMDSPKASIALPLSFQAHDLQRRWVQFQMAADFKSQEDASPEGQPAGAPAAAHQVDALAGVDVPDWMRGGGAIDAASSAYAPGCLSAGYRPTGFLTPSAEYRRASYYSMMSEVACQYGIPVGLFDAMIIRESRYLPTATSPKSAFGLTQLMPGTAASLGVNQFDVEQNLRGGARYLRRQLDRFGQVHLALAAYNAGPGRVRGGLVPRIYETQDYVAEIITNWRRLTALPRRASMQSVAAAAPDASQRAVGAGRLGRVASVSIF